MRLRTTADKRLRYASSKLPLVTSFIPGTLAEMPKIFVKRRCKNGNILCEP